MTIQHSTNISGAVTFWTLPERLDHGVLKAGLVAAGFGGSAPEPSSGVPALKRALMRVAAGRRRLVRPLPCSKDGDFATHNARGYSVVDETVLGERTLPDGTKTTELAHAESYCVVLLPGGESLVFDRESPEADSVRKAFAEESGVVTDVQVSSALVGVLWRLRAISLRPTGGVYYLPQNGLVAWANVSKAVVEAADAAGTNPARIYQVRTQIDDEAVRAVADAVTRELDQAAAAIEAALSDSDHPLGRRALDTKAEDAAALAEKAKFYETLLGTVINKAALVRVDAEVNAVMAAMEARARQDEAREAKAG